MEQSVLNTVKKLLGIADTYDCFDTDILIHINSVLSILNHIGVATTNSITGATNKWSDVLPSNTDAKVLDMVKSYVYFKVRMMFDPPTSGAVSDSIKSMIAELEWRLNEISDK